MKEKEIIREILSSAKSIAVVGISRKAEAVSRIVAEYMQQHGFAIIPINPISNKIMGQKCYHSVADIPHKVDVINIFRKPEALVKLAEEIVAMPHKPTAVWFQLGITNNDAAKILENSGIKVVQNRCIKVELAASGLKQ